LLTTQTHKEHAQSAHGMNTLGTTFLLITHIPHTKRELQILNWVLIVGIQNDLQDMFVVLGVMYQISIPGLLTSQTTFLQIRPPLQIRPNIHASVDHVFY